MAAHGARRLTDMADNLAAYPRHRAAGRGQGIELARAADDQPGAGSSHRALLARAVCRTLDADRYMAPDLATAAELVDIRRAAARPHVASAHINPSLEPCLKRSPCHEPRLDNARIIRAPRGP